MIHLRRITIENFKGIKQITCEFDDLTILAGPNNAGKTTILQAVHFIVSAFRSAKGFSVDQRWSTNVNVRQIDLTAPMSLFGLDDPGALLPPNSTEPGVIRAQFSYDIPIELRLQPNGSAYFSIPVEDSERERVDQTLSSWTPPLSEPLTPPGDLPTRETMIPYQQYVNEVRSGQGPRFWRNSLWWALQAEGIESYRPLADLVRRYFPSVELRAPRLSTQNNNILVDYKEDDRGPFDVYQSGAGLRSFISLARMLEVSGADIVLLDEPDAHLHSAQQAVVFDLLAEASQGKRQVIVATHSPEIISRAPVESLRWIERGSETAQGGEDVATLLERLGATPDLYLPLAKHHDLIIYVEGKTDKPIIESLIRWCAKSGVENLASTLVIPHKEGQYDAVALQAIVRYLRTFHNSARVVGIRDLDWNYCERPAVEPERREGEGYTLLTLHCKEIENLFCDLDLLDQVFENLVTREQLAKILGEESNLDDLVDEWRFQLMAKIRKRLDSRLDDATRESEAEAIFQDWRSDPETRARLVAGKLLLSRVRARVKCEYHQGVNPNSMLDRVRSLPPRWAAIAGEIFPGVDWLSKTVTREPETTNQTVTPTVL